MREFHTIGDLAELLNNLSLVSEALSRAVAKRGVDGLPLDYTEDERVILDQLAKSVDVSRSFFDGASDDASPT